MVASMASPGGAEASQVSPNLQGSVQFCFHPLPALAGTSEDPQREEQHPPRKKLQPEVSTVSRVERESGLAPLNEEARSNADKC